MDRPLTFEDDYWVFFGYGEGWPRDKCARCREELQRTKRPNEHCINCWKLEIFFSNCADLAAVKAYLLSLAAADPTLHGKWLKQEMEIPRGVLTSIPQTAHPGPEVKKDGAILIYTQTISEREARRKRILAGLLSRSLYRKSDISYRRGCVDFDRILGDWREWHDIDRDFDGRENGTKSIVGSHQTARVTLE